MSPLWSTLSSVADLLISLGVTLIAVWLFCWLSLLAHELGHYLAGRLVGLRAREIRLGSGRIWQVFHWGHVQWIVHRHPISGWVARFNEGNRFQHAILILGGPVATALLAFALWRLVWFPLAPPRPAVLRELMGLCQMFAMMETAALCVTLWPSYYQMHGERVRNDGLLLWHTLFPPRETQISDLFTQALRALESGEKEEAARLAREAAASCEPGAFDEAQAFLAHVLAEAGQVEEAAAVYREILDTMKPAHPKFPAFADGLASLALYHHVPSLFVESEAAIRKTLAVYPKLLTLKGTLGGLLVERGSDEEARPLLEELHALCENETDLAISAAYMSVLARRRGDVQAGKKLGRLAMRLLPEHPLVKRVLAESPDTASTYQAAV